MAKYPRRLSELTPIKFDDDDDDVDPKVSSKSQQSTVSHSLQPKRLVDIYAESSDLEEQHDDPAQLDSSGFDENVSEDNSRINSSTPIGKENDKNSCNRNGTSSCNKCRLNEDHENCSKSIEASHSNITVMPFKCSNGNTTEQSPVDFESTKVSTAPLQPRSLMFSPIEVLKVAPKNNPQSTDNIFATPSVKAPLTTGRVIFSSSQHKLRPPRKLDADCQQSLFTTPQAITNRPASSNTSDYLTEHSNSVKKTSFASYLSPIDEEKISIDDFQALSASGDDNALTNKVLEINGKDFFIKKKIGCGGSCLVYSGKSKNNGRDCALKMVNLRTEASNVASYLNETKLLERLQGSDCVIKLFEYLHCPDKYSLILVMELGESDLNKELKAYRSDIPLNKMMSYWQQMLKVVKYIHDNGVIHSDLKPANFLLVNGKLKLIDFGIASNISMDATSVIKFSQTGTFNYISPEAMIDTSNESTQNNKYKISTKSDVWSLGCIFYLCVYRRTPFSHIKNFYAKYSAITSSDTVIEYPALPMYYPPMLIEMIQKCLQFNPKNRSSVDDLMSYPMNMINDSII